VAARSPSSSKDLCLASGPCRVSDNRTSSSSPQLEGKATGEGWHRAGHFTEAQGLDGCEEEILTVPTASGCQGTPSGRRL